MASQCDSALLAFRGENIRSFADAFELSLQATQLAETGAVRTLRRNQKGGTIGVLPAAGIFGANGSGKSNVLRALDDMRQAVLFSFRSVLPEGGFPRKPFLLDPKYRQQPTRLEVDLVLDGVRTQYGFEVDNQHVVREWATRWPRGAPARIFDRNGSAVSHGSGLATVGRRVEALLRPNALFLSTAAQANHPELTPLFGWFARNLLLAEANSRPKRHALTAQLWSDDAIRPAVRGLVRAADLGITGIDRATLDPEERDRIERAVRILSGSEPDRELPEVVPDPGLRLRHGPSSTELAPDDESLGTLVWLGLVGPVLLALAHGTVLLADELDASLHPRLVHALVELFSDPATNSRCAQLIFNAHDVTLLGNSQAPRLLGRDQIWFTSKGDDGRSTLYPLTEFGPRQHEAIARRYLQGHYGATPMLAEGDFAAALEQLRK